MKYKVLEKYKKEGLIVPGTYDKAFKSIMQNKKCREFLIETINYCTKIPKDVLKKELIIKNSELPVTNLNEKRKITDLVLEVDNNIINLEMNNFYYNGLIERNDMYLNALRNANAPYKYFPITKVIQINFDNFTLFDERTLIKFVIMDEERHLIETNSYEKYHINLKRIKEKYYNNEELTLFENRMLILMVDNIYELEKISRGDAIMEKVKDEIIALSQDEALILCYDEEKYKEEVRRKVTETQMLTAREEGLKSGLEEGKKQGLEEGIKEGIKEGKNKSIKEIALNLLKSNIDINIISSSTGLSIEEINSLK